MPPLLAMSGRLVDDSGSSGGRGRDEGQTRVDAHRARSCGQFRSRSETVGHSRRRRRCCCRCRPVVVVGAAGHHQGGGGELFYPGGARLGRLRPVTLSRSTGRGRGRDVARARNSRGGGGGRGGAARGPVRLDSDLADQLDYGMCCTSRERERKCVFGYITTRDSVCVCEFVYIPTRLRDS